MRVLLFILVVMTFNVSANADTIDVRRFYNGKEILSFSLELYPECVQNIFGSMRAKMIMLRNDSEDMLLEDATLKFDVQRLVEQGNERPVYQVTYSLSRDNSNHTLATDSFLVRHPDECSLRYSDLITLAHNAREERQRGRNRGRAPAVIETETSISTSHEGGGMVVDHGHVRAY